MQLVKLKPTLESLFFLSENREKKRNWFVRFKLKSGKGVLAHGRGKVTSF
jgi:hypothetical protein